MAGQASPHADLILAFGQADIRDRATDRNMRNKFDDAYLNIFNDSIYYLPSICARLDDMKLIAYQESCHIPVAVSLRGCMQDPRKSASS